MLGASNGKDASEGAGCMGAGKGAVEELGAEGPKEGAEGPKEGLGAEGSEGFQNNPITKPAITKNRRNGVIRSL